MQLNDLIARRIPPEPWAEGEKIPWNDPSFSERMLKEHLSQKHDKASRRQTVIDQHISWIERTCLPECPARILDLACGPGLYLQKLAQQGHNCAGIDFSPAAIAYARSQAAQADLKIDYVQGDLRTVDYGEGFDLVMLIFGEFNVFTRDDARHVLKCIYRALTPEGRLVLEPQTYDAIQKEGTALACWSTRSAGLFSADPHFWLEEHFWHPDCHAATTRYFIIDAATGDVDKYASTSQAYTEEDFDQLLTDAGFSGVQRFPSLTGVESRLPDGLCVLLAKKA